MTERFILEHVPRRMHSLGVYSYREDMQMITIPAGAKFTIGAYNQFLFIPVELIDLESGIQVASSFGRIGYGDPRSVFEHTGAISIENNGPNPTTLSFYLISPQ